MGVGGLGHLGEAEIDPFGEKHVQQPDSVGAGHAGAQVREGVGESCGGVDIHHDVGDTGVGNAFVEVEEQLAGAGGRVSGEALDVEASIADRPAGDGFGACRMGKSVESVRHPGPSVGYPLARLVRHGQPGVRRRDRNSDQSAGRIGMAPRAWQPGVAGPQRVSQVEQDGDLP